MSIWGSVKHAFHHAAHKAEEAGKAAEETVEQAGETAIDLEENKDPQDAEVPDLPG